jgi:hypothetical protein
MPSKKHLNIEDKLRQGRKRIRMKVSGKSTFAILDRIKATKKIKKR